MKYLRNYPSISHHSSFTEKKFTKKNDQLFQFLYYRRYIRENQLILTCADSDLQVQSSVKFANWSQSSLISWTASKQKKLILFYSKSVKLSPRPLHLIYDIIGSLLFAIRMLYIKLLFQTCISDYISCYLICLSLESQIDH